MLANRPGVPRGSVNVLVYGQTIYLLPWAVLAVPVATSVFPRLAEAAERSQFERDRQAMETRLASAPREEAEEAVRIRARYTNLTDHAFPLAVVVVVPETVTSERGS